MSSEIAVDAASAFLQNIQKTAGTGNPYNLAFSTKSATTDIAADALKFADQIVAAVNKNGTDTDTRTLNIDEFTRLASGGKITKFTDITDSAKQALIKDTFNGITHNGATLTASDLADHITLRDSADGTTDGNAVINFLI